MKSNNFIYSLEETTNTNRTLIVKIDQINSKQELLKIYSDKLYFPDYFGFNWDALWDCLLDLSWISQNKIIIYHSCVPNLSSKEIFIYLKMLHDMVERWRNDDEFETKEIQVCFDKRDKDMINNFLIEE